MDADKYAQTYTSMFPTVKMVVVANLATHQQKFPNTIPSVTRQLNGLAKKAKLPPVFNDRNVIAGLIAIFSAAGTMGGIWFMNQPEEKKEKILKALSILGGQEKPVPPTAN